MPNSAQYVSTYMRSAQGNRRNLTSIPPFTKEREYKRLDKDRSKKQTEEIPSAIRERFVGILR